jgi:hypothetical protein
MGMLVTAAVEVPLLVAVVVQLLVAVGRPGGERCAAAQSAGRRRGWGPERGRLLGPKLGGAGAGTGGAPLVCVAPATGAPARAAALAHR